jgi:AAA family ATP:ADP antiporter
LAERLPAATETATRLPRTPRAAPYFAAVAIAIAAAFTLAGYEFLRSPTSTLYKAAYGKQSLPMVMAGLPVAVALVLYVYARILSWLGPRRTLLATTLGSAAIIAVCQQLFDRGHVWAVVVLELYGSAYVVLLIEQYWSFLNSALSESDARRLNGPICGIASLGSIAAGAAGAVMTKSLGTSAMILMAAASTLPAAFFADWAYRRCGEPVDQKAPGGLASGGHLALAEFRQNRVLVLLLAIIVATQVVAAFLSLSFQGSLQDVIPNADEQTAYSYAFYAWLNGAAAVLQFAAAPLLLRLVRPALLHFVIPCIHVVALLVYMLSPSLETIAAAYLIFKAVDYSVFRAAKEILYIPLPFDARYRAKEVIDVFGYRFSKGITAGGVALAQGAGLAASEVGFAALAIAACGLWAALAVPLSKLYRAHSSAR